MFNRNMIFGKGAISVGTVGSDMGFDSEQVRLLPRDSELFRDAVSGLGHDHAIEWIYQPIIQHAVNRFSHADLSVICSGHREW